MTKDERRPSKTEEQKRAVREGVQRAWAARRVGGIRGMQNRDAAATAMKGREQKDLVRYALPDERTHTRRDGFKMWPERIAGSNKPYSDGLRQIDAASPFRRKEWPLVAGELRSIEPCDRARLSVAKLRGGINLKRTSKLVSVTK